MLYGFDGFLYICAIFENKKSGGLKTALHFTVKRFLNRPTFYYLNN